jgi:hypothetical protein
MEAYLLLVVLVVLVAFAFFFALQIFRALQAVVSQIQSVASLADQIHARDQKALQTVLDRLMAVDFTAFKDYNLAEAAMEGSVEQETAEMRRRERPWLTPGRTERPPSEEPSAFRRDHDARYGPAEDLSSQDETQILQQLEEEGLPR